MTSNNSKHAADEQPLSALAQPTVTDGPAVPQSREPAAVAGEPSDEEGPSVEEVEELCEEHCFNVEGYESIECLQGLINEAIARWGNPAPVPAEGEVAELVTELRRICFDVPPSDADTITRAADLLERQSVAEGSSATVTASVPVPVSERLPEPGDCDAEERCWLLAPRWILPPSELTHWLPAHALPLPQGEAES